MKSLITYLILSSILLVGCRNGATIQDYENSLMTINSKLPEGCKLSFLGEIIIPNDQRSSRIFLTECSNPAVKVQSLSESHEFTTQVGKTPVTTTLDTIVITIDKRTGKVVETIKK